MVAAAAVLTASNPKVLTNPLTTVNGKGTLSTVSMGAPVDMTNPFFQSLGTNGRTCGSCHVPSAGWGITPNEVQTRFERTKGMDPIFRTVDGANCPSSDVSTLEARRSAYSQLLTKGLIRVSLAVPPTADFQIVDIQDPYNCRETTAAAPAFYRRPLPSTNLPFLTTVMWDGRESAQGSTLQQNLARQVVDATLGHAEAASAPSPEEVAKIVDLEFRLFTAQQTGQKVGSLSVGGAASGAMNLSKQEFYEGINDVLGADPNGRPFDPVTFTTYKAWLNSPDPHKASVARGEVLFNTFPILITGVKGLNDLPGLQVVNGTCTTCHDSPNVGNHSVPLAINIGVTDPDAALDVAGLPVYTVKCITSGETIRTTDLGRAMVTGKCADVGKTKGPVLRGLPARAPYFHNGAAATLEDAVEFYNTRFHMSLSDQQKKDLVAFLETL
jgi:hypothetical protein